MKKVLMLCVCLFAGCVSSPPPRKACCPEPRPFVRERTVTETESVSLPKEEVPKVENIRVIPTKDLPLIPPAGPGAQKN